MGQSPFYRPYTAVRSLDSCSTNVDVPFRRNDRLIIGKYGREANMKSFVGSRIPKPQGPLAGAQVGADFHGLN